MEDWLNDGRDMIGLYCDPFEGFAGCVFFVIGLRMKDVIMNN
jgi:hypothetical protein